MKKLPWVLLAALFCFSGCQSQQDKKIPEAPSEDQTSTVQMNSEQLVGGWTQQDISGPVAEENTMILTAIMAKSNPDVTLGKFRGFWTQVVAGHNVKMLVDYTQGSKSGILTAILFHDLEGNVFLKSLEL